MKRLFFIPVIALALFFAGRELLPHDVLRLFYRLDVLLLAGLASVFCARTAVSFEAGSHLRLAWYLNAASYGFVLLGAAVRIPESSHAMLIARNVLVIFGNVLGIASMWLFARTYRVAGLELPDSPLRKYLMVAGSVVLALLASGHSVYLGVKEGLGGDLEAWVGAISGVGDIITFILIAPVLMTALALRGGLLVWPWGFFVASNIAWLLFDAQDTLAYFVPGVAGQVLDDYTETWRSLGCALTICAALAQSRLSRGEEQT